jgi:hypothetical protein
LLDVNNNKVVPIRRATHEGVIIARPDCRNCTYKENGEIYERAIEKFAANLIKLAKELR